MKSVATRKDANLQIPKKKKQNDQMIKHQEYLKISIKFINNLNINWPLKNQQEK